MLGRQAVIYSPQEPSHVMWPLLNVTGTCRLYLYKLADTDIVSNKFIKPHSFSVCYNFSFFWRKRKIYVNFEIKLEETTSPIPTTKVFDLLFAHRIAGEKLWKGYFSMGTTGEKITISMKSDGEGFKRRAIGSGVKQNWPGVLAGWTLTAYTMAKLSSASIRWKSLPYIVSAIKFLSL